MPDTPPTYEELERFIETQTESGRIGGTSGQAMTLTLRRLKSTLVPGEAEDVQQLDVDDVIHRFANLNRGVVGPSSLASYKSRLVSARRMFLEWREDPVRWKPRSSPAASPRVKVASNGKKKDSGSEKEGPDGAEADDGPPTGSTLNYPFPLRDGLIVRLVGLPPDLNQADVERIARFLRVLCVD